MGDERLIELVRENIVLYDLSHGNYLDTKYKTCLWNKIGEQMKLDGATCKARWNNIRDNYRKSLKKTETKSGQRTNVKLYKYHDQLSFIKQYFKERPMKSMLDSQEGVDIITSEDEEGQQTFSIRAPPSPLFVSTPSPSPSSMIVPSPSSPAPTQNPSTSRKRKYAKNYAHKTAAALFMEYVLEKNQANIQHPVDAFLSGISPTLKTLDPYNLNLAKSEIFATVQKYEMKMLKGQNVGQTPGINMILP